MICIGKAEEIYQSNIFLHSMNTINVYQVQGEISIPSCFQILPKILQFIQNFTFVSPFW